MANFNQEPKYNRNWQSGKFKNVTFSGSNISQFANDSDFLVREGYNTGSFTGDFTGSISITDLFTLTPVDSFPKKATPGSLLTMLNDDRISLSLYFFNGNEWKLIT